MLQKRNRIDRKRKSEEELRGWRHKDRGEKEKTIMRRRIEMRPYHFPQTLVAATTKSFRYAASDKLLSFGG